MYFFQFPKGKQKRKGKETKTCSRTSTNNLALILTRVIFLGDQPTTRTHFHLSREYQLWTYSLDFFKTKIGSKRLVVIYPPVGGRERSLDDTDFFLFIYLFIFFFFLTALLTITHITYSKLNSQEKKWNICAKWFKVIRSKGKVRTGREDPCEAPPMVQIIIKTRSTKRRQI